MKVKKYRRFSLILMVTHDCNLRCKYCYSGEKTRRVMELETALTAVRRAITSIEKGGTLEIGFFGGEPLLEAGLIENIIQHSTAMAGEAELALQYFLTTNGTVTNATVWKLMLRPDIRVSISCDGTSRAHDQNRVTPAGSGTWDQVYSTIKNLLRHDSLYSVVSVISPDTIETMADNIRFFISEGIKNIEPNLDLWSRWKLAELDILKESIRESIGVWKEALPEISITWFDEKLAMLTGKCHPSFCRFGNGEIAVAPGGSLYPCERLIGEDKADNPFRIPNGIKNADNFLTPYESKDRSYPACDECGIKQYCSTNCRCSNYVRSGRTSQPDKLLCVKEKTCIEEIANFLTRQEV